MSGQKAIGERDEELLVPSGARTAPISAGDTIGAPPTPRRRRRREGLVGWAFLAPLVVITLLVTLGPSAATIYYSFTRWSGLGAAKFIGLANYRKLIHDPDFHQAALHNLEWMALSLTIPIAMGLLGAYLLSRIRRLQLLFRTLYFLPYVLASVVTAALWQNILDPNQGILDQVSRLGLPSGHVFFFGQRLALPTIFFINNWAWWGFLVVVFLAAMQSVDRQLYEAATIDGASQWRQFWDVTIPGIRPTLVFMLVMTVIWSTLIFDYVYIITQGGPGGASEVIATYAYKTAFSEYDAGYASTLGLGMTVIPLTVITLYLMVRRRWRV